MRWRPLVLSVCLGLGLGCRGSFDQLDGSTSAEETSSPADAVCEERFSGVEGFVLCEASEESCTFRIEKDDNQAQCQNVCAGRGADCVAGIRNSTDTCALGATNACNLYVSDHCICAAGCGDGDLCALGQNCNDGVCE